MEATEFRPLRQLEEKNGRLNKRPDSYTRIGLNRHSTLNWRWGAPCGRAWAVQLQSRSW